MKQFNMKQFNFKQYYDQFMTNKLFKNTVITYSIIACAIFLLFSVTATLIISDAAINQLTDSEQKMLEQAENTSDTILRYINYMMTDNFENNDTILDSLSKPYSPELSVEISTMISTMKNSFDIIDKVYLFNLSNDLVYTGENPVYTVETFPDKELLDYIKTSAPYTVNTPFVLKYEDGSDIVSGVTSVKEKNVLMSVYKLESDAAMAIFIDSESFDSLVNVRSNPSRQSTTIFNSYGEVISATDPALFGTDMSDDEIYKKLVLQRDDSGAIESLGKIYFYRRGLNSFYVSEIYKSDIVGSFISQFIIILIFGFILIALLFISSIRLSVSVYKPFSRLRGDIINILNIDSDAETGTDEDLSRISKQLADVKSRYDSMQTTEQLYTNSKRSELVYNIINGAYNFDGDVLKEYSISFPYLYSTVLLFRIDNAKKVQYGNMGLIKYGLANVASEIMSDEDIVAYSTEFGNEYDVIFIANHKSEVFDEGYIKDIQKYVLNIFQVTVSAAYDTGKHDIESLPHLYRNAEYAMQYRLVRGHNSIISYNSLAYLNEGKETAYPAAIEKELIKGINAKSEDMTNAAVREFIEYVSTLPYLYITTYACTLIMKIDMYAKASADKSEHDAIADELTKIETIDALEAIIKSRCNNALTAADRDYVDTKYTMIANSIEDFINKNYTDPNLSIYVIADYVNKSANYARNIFKQNKGISISDYITQKRFGEVCRLLLETDMTAQAIGQRVGMSSGSYFYTAFKKYTGCTPEQYRKKYKGTDITPPQR